MTVTEQTPSNVSGSAPRQSAPAPEQIFLQACGDCRDDCSSCNERFVATEEVTWCQDRVFDSDVPYLRHDRVLQVIQECIQRPSGVVPEAVKELLGDAQWHAMRVVSQIPEKDAYRMNTANDWAKHQLNILADMAEQRGMRWFADEVRKTANGLRHL